MADKPIGNLFVRVGADVANFVRGMTTVERASNRTRTSIQSFARGGVASLGAVFSGVQLGQFTKELLTLGIAAEEAGTKFRRTFGPAGDDLRDFVDTFAGAGFGLATQAADDLLSRLGAIGQGMGLASDVSADFAATVVRLGTDLAAFNNIDPERGINAMTGALLGQRVALRNLGVQLSAAEIKTRALALSGKTSEGELTKLDEAAATLNITVEKMGPAFNAFIEEADGAAGKTRILAAAFTDLKTSIGVFGTPAVAAGAGFLTKAIEGVNFQIARFRFSLSRGGDLLRNVFGEGGPTAEALERTAELRDNMVELAAGTDGAAEAFEQFRVTGEDLIQPTVSAGEAGELLTTTWETMGTQIALVLPKLEGLTAATVANEVAAAGAAAANEKFKGALSGIGKVGGIFGKIGGILGTFGLGLGPLGIAGGLLGKIGSFAGLFAGGGMIPAGKFGVVGESGPELVSGPANVTPTGGDIVINIVTESGRALVDAIRVKDVRDSDIRRVVRVPVSAVATG